MVKARLALFALGLTVVGASTMKKQSGSDSVTTLLSALKELQTETSKGRHVSGEIAGWCHSVSKGRKALADSLDRQLDESKVAKQQIVSALQQLEGEKNFVETTRQQKEERLADTVSTSQLVEADFDDEHGQLTKALESTKQALNLLQKQMNQGGPVPTDSLSSLLQVHGDKMSDDEKDLVSSFVDNRHTGKADALHDALTNLHDRLIQENSDAVGDHQEVQQRLWNFGDHLNSTVMEMKSQVAAITMEKAHHVRERAMLQSKIAEIGHIRRVVATSSQTAQVACKMEAQKAAQATDVISEEVKSIRTLLQKLPSGGSDLLGVPDSATSFLQVRRSGEPLMAALAELQGAAGNFPDQSAWLQTGAAPAEVPEKVYHGKHAFKLAAKKPKQQMTASADPLASIAAFGGQDAMPVSQATSAVEAVPTSLVNQTTRKQKLASGMERWCAAVVRDAQADGEAFGRALKRTDAKLKLAKITALTSQRDAGFFQQQESNIIQEMPRLHALIEEDTSEYKRSNSALRAVGEQLLSLSTTLSSDDATLEERKASDLAHTLVDHFDQHIDQWEEWHESLRKNIQAVSKAEQALADELAEATHRNQRRLTSFKDEAQLLTSLDHAKAFDESQSLRYTQLSEKLCSAQHLRALQTQV